MISSARATLNTALIGALAQTSDITGLNITNSEPVIAAIIEYLFMPSMRWAVLAYLAEVSKSNDLLLLEDTDESDA